jgi:hypothetical protein
MNKGEMTLRVWLHIFSYSIVLIAAGNTAVALATKISVANGINNISIIFGIVLAMIVVLSIMYLFKRDNFLPFLSYTAFPCDPVPEKYPENWDTEVPISTGMPDKNIVYWAAESSEKIQDNPILAYGKMTNSGVTRTDADGNAVLKVRNPSSYIVDHIPYIKRKMNPHIHYRICVRDSILDTVKTIYVPKTT